MLYIDSRGVKKEKYIPKILRYNTPEKFGVLHLTLYSSPFQVLAEEYQRWGLPIVVSSVYMWSHSRQNIVGSLLV